MGSSWWALSSCGGRTSPLFSPQAPSSSPRQYDNPLFNCFTSLTRKKPLVPEYVSPHTFSSIQTNAMSCRTECNCVCMLLWRVWTQGFFHGTSDCLVTVHDVVNVTLAGYGSTWVMQKADYANVSAGHPHGVYTKSEHRYAVVSVVSVVCVCLCVSVCVSMCMWVCMFCVCVWVCGCVGVQVLLLCECRSTTMAPDCFVFDVRNTPQC